MVNVGFIGFGRMGITHYSILNTHPSVKIVSVCDQSSTMLKILSKYVDVNTYSDYGKMLDDSEKLEGSGLTIQHYGFIGLLGFRETMKLKGPF